MADLIIGSICLSDIPKELIKAVQCRDGKVRKYLNISIVPKKTPQTYTNGGVQHTYTHFISCQPKESERREGVNYILGNAETHVPRTQPLAPSPSAVAAAPAAAPGQGEDLPF